MRILRMVGLLALCGSLGACASLGQMGAARVKATREAENKGVTLNFSTLEASNAAKRALEAMGMDAQATHNTEKGPDSFAKTVVGYRPAKAERTGALEGLTKSMGGKPMDMIKLEINGKWNDALDAAAAGKSVCRFETSNANRDLTGAYHPEGKVENPALVKEAKAALVKAAQAERELYNKGFELRSSLDKVEAAVRAVLASYDPDFDAAKRAGANTLGPGGGGRFFAGKDKREVSKGSDLVVNLVKGAAKSKERIASHSEKSLTISFQKKWDDSLVSEEPGVVILSVLGDSMDIDTDGKASGRRKLNEAEQKAVADDIKSRL